jgi:hypothetical protein
VSAPEVAAVHLVLLLVLQLLLLQLLTFFLGQTVAVHYSYFEILIYYYN